MPSYSQLFRVRAFVAIFAGNTLSAWGDQLARLTVAAFVLERSGSPLAAPRARGQPHPLAVRPEPARADRRPLPVPQRAHRGQRRPGRAGRRHHRRGRRWVVAGVVADAAVRPRTRRRAGGHVDADPAHRPVRGPQALHPGDRPERPVRAGQPGHRARCRRRHRLRRGGHQRAVVRPGDVPPSVPSWSPWPYAHRPVLWDAERRTGWGTSTTSSPAAATSPGTGVLAAMLTPQPGHVLGHRGAGGGRPGLRGRVRAARYGGHWAVADGRGRAGPAGPSAGGSRPPERFASSPSRCQMPVPLLATAFQPPLLV